MIMKSIVGEKIVLITIIDIINKIVFRLGIRNRNCFRLLGIINNIINQ